MRVPPSTGELSADQAAIVADENAMAARVARRVAASLAAASEERKPVVKVRHNLELVALRDQIAEARNEDVAALLAQMIQTAGVAQVELPKVTGAIDPATPYFGHLRLQEAGRSRDVLIGKRGMVDRAAGVVIVDWRDAPVSRIYYRYDEGDDYEEELGDKVREGTVIARRTTTFVDGQLMRVRSPSGTLVRAERNSDAWNAIERAFTPELAGGVGKAERAPAIAPTARGRLGALGDTHLRADKHLPEIAALIDDKQFDAMTQPDSGVVILQGGAGSGKTTVALHRVAFLTYASGEEQRFRPAHIMVVVAQPQLVRYVERLLPALDVGGVKVFAYSTWAKATLERVLGKHKRRFVEDAPGDIGRLKKHPAMLMAIDAQVQRRVSELGAALSVAVTGRPHASDVEQLWDGSAMRSVWPVPRMAAFLDALRVAPIDADTRERARRTVQAARERLLHLGHEWEELITDEGLLALSLDARWGAQAMERPALENCLRYTKRQVEEVPDDSDVDEDARIPVDDAGPDPDDPNDAFDVYDPALFLNMVVARHGTLVGRNGEPVAYDHVVVDEAQDLSAVEIKPLLASTGPRRSLTLAGDVVQKIHFDAGYDTWEEFEDQLGIRALNVEPLKLSYRSTAEVVDFAREVLGPLAPKDPPRAVRTGAPIEVFSFADPGEEIAFLAENLRALMAREPQANVAVLTRYPERARFFAKMLQHAEVPRLRLVLGHKDADPATADDFSFAPGIDVTHVSRVKGLEYDYVVLVDVTEAMYPDHIAARHLLHIGATRAAHQLWITTSTQSPSPLLPKSLLDDSAL